MNERERDGQARAGRLAAHYSKPIYAFARARTSRLQDAEDLAQEICLKIYRSFLAKDDIREPDRFVWTMARNALANYYRGKARAGAGPILTDEVERAAEEPGIENRLVEKEAREALRQEIAFLAKTQRSIVILHYYSGLKQTEIAERLKLPLGTVKWHLREAKQELKKGLGKVREASMLKFHPIRFERMGFSGMVGTKGSTEDFFRSALSQNIAYSVWRKARTVNEIAELLGVSPVYVEAEADYLEEYGFLLRDGGQYRANLLIEEPSDEINRVQSEMYETVSGLFANELLDELTASGLLEDPGLEYPDGDRNFLLWALLFYVAACSGEPEAGLSFEQAATRRPDGGFFVPYAAVEDPTVAPVRYADAMERWSGPCWNGNEKLVLWFVNSEWSARSRELDAYVRNVGRDLQLLDAFTEGRPLSPEDYAYLADMGFIKRMDSGRFELAIVRIANVSLRRRLLDVGSRLKERHRGRMEEWKERYTKLDLARTPEHLRLMLRFGHQYLFHSDGWFLLHCAKALVASGRLTEPNENQRKSLSVLLVPADR